MAALHDGNADGKQCSKACVPEVRFLTAAVAVPNGTALIAALCSLHISMTLQHSASQWNASDQMLMFLSPKSIFWQHFTMETLMANSAAKPVSLKFVFSPLKVAVPNGTALIAALCSLHISMTLQHSASQWNASDQMLMFLSTKSIFWQHFTMETLMANSAAKPVSLQFVFSPLKVAVPNGTALIPALGSLHISMTLQHSASQWTLLTFLFFCGVSISSSMSVMPNPKCIQNTVLIQMDVDVTNCNRPCSSKKNRFARVCPQTLKATGMDAGIKNEN